MFLELKLRTVDTEAVLNFSQILMLIIFNLNLHPIVMMQLQLVSNLFILCEY